VEAKVQPGNRILVYIDKKNGEVTLRDCSTLSRKINESLNRDLEDFELEVSSPGLSSSFKVKEQYVKNIGRIVEIKKTDGNRISGKLLSIDDNGILLEITQKTKTEWKKKMELQMTQQTILLSEIKETKIKVIIK
jgi:ribosome maturation factor RimP